MNDLTCSVDGCEAPVDSRRLCGRHSMQMRRAGRLDEFPLVGKPTPPHGSVARYTRGCHCDDCTAAARDRKRRYRREHAETVKAAQDAYEAANKAKSAARKKADREANPEKYRKRNLAWARSESGSQLRHLTKLRRRAREANADTRQVTAKDWLGLVRQYRGCCAYCGASDKPLTREHIIPLARGGRHSIGNLLPVCGSCNYSKADRLLVEWRAWKKSVAA